MKKNKKIYKIILILIIGTYAVFTLINQQKMLNQYTSNAEDLAQEIQEEQETKEELAQKKDNVDSLEYIEQMAREKLDMYYPNDRVYIGAGV